MKKGLQKEDAKRMTKHVHNNESRRKIKRRFEKKEKPSKKGNKEN